MAVPATWPVELRVACDQLTPLLVEYLTKTQVASQFSASLHEPFQNILYCTWIVVEVAPVKDTFVMFKLLAFKLRPSARKTTKNRNWETVFIIWLSFVTKLFSKCAHKILQIQIKRRKAQDLIIATNAASQVPVPNIALATEYAQRATQYTANELNSLEDLAEAYKEFENIKKQIIDTTAEEKLIQDKIVAIKKVPLDTLNHIEMDKYVKEKMN